MTLPLAKVASSWELSRWPLILLYFLSVHFCALAKLVFKQFVVSRNFFSLFYDPSFQYISLGFNGS